MQLNTQRRMVVTVEVGVIGGADEIGRLSVNLPDAPEPGPGQFWAKTWSENERLARKVLDAGLAVDTGIRHPTGFTEGQLWELAPKNAQKE